MKTFALTVVSGLTCVALLVGTSAGAGSKSSGGGGGGQHHQPVHNHPGYVHPGYIRPVVVPVYRPGYVVEAPWQNVRYLRVSNQTGEPLTVYVRMGNGSTTQWSFAPYQVAHLAIDGEWLTASEVLIWGQSPTRIWNQYRGQALVMVPEPYQSDAIGTHTLTFNP